MSCVKACPIMIKVVTVSLSNARKQCLDPQNELAREITSQLKAGVCDRSLPQCARSNTMQFTVIAFSYSRTQDPRTEANIFPSTPGLCSRIIEKKPSSNHKEFNLMCSEGVVPACKVVSSISIQTQHEFKRAVFTISFNS